MASGSKEHYGKGYARDDLSQDVDVSVTRNGNDYITQIVLANGTYTKMVTLTRDGNDYITGIAVTVT